MQPENPKENSPNCLQNVSLLTCQLSLMHKLTMSLNWLSHARQLRFNQYYLGGYVAERVEAVSTCHESRHLGAEAEAGGSGGRLSSFSGSVSAMRDLEKVT